MENTCIEFEKWLEKRKVIAFGCGFYFRKALLSYPMLKEKVEFIIDNYTSGEYIYENKKWFVYSPQKILELNLDEYIVVFFANKWKEMEEQLDSNLELEYQSFHFPFGINYIVDKKRNYYHRIVVPIIEELEKNGKIHSALDLCHVYSKGELIKELEDMKKTAVPRVPVVLTPKCTLRCKECSNLMWRFEDFRDLSTDKIIVSLENMIKCFDFLPCVELIGGEPFVAGNLKEVLDYLIQQKKVLNIEITTNGTILPRQELRESLKNEKVIVRVSDYSMVVNQDKFVLCMEENNIKFEKLIFEGWCETGGIEKRNRDSEALIRQYYNCEAGYLCKTLWEERLYPCARAASLAVLGIHENCPYVDMKNDVNLQQRILQFWMAPTCGPCDYCNTGLDEQILVKPAEQLKKI